MGAMSSPHRHADDTHAAQRGKDGWSFARHTSHEKCNKPNAWKRDANGLRPMNHVFCLVLLARAWKRYAPTMLCCHARPESKTWARTTPDRENLCGSLVTAIASREIHGLWRGIFCMRWTHKNAAESNWTALPPRLAMPASIYCCLAPSNRSPKCTERHVTARVCTTSSKVDRDRTNVGAKRGAPDPLANRHGARPPHPKDGGWGGGGVRVTWDTDGGGGRDEGARK